MRIIKPGIITTYRETCKFCGCEFEYNSSEVNMVDPDLPLKLESLRYILCPCCARCLQIKMDVKVEDK